MDSPSSLELFLLAAVKEGCTTAYELRAQARLSIGSTQPALQRMVKNGWLGVETAGSRGRMQHRLTAKGAKELASWKKHVDRAIDDSPRDVEGIFRLAAMCWQHKDRGRLKKLLNVITNKPSEEEAVPFSATLTGFYSWLSGLQAAEQHRSNLRLFKEISARLKHR